MIVIEPSAITRLAFKPFSVAFAKFWGYPLKLVSSREEASQVAAEMISEREGSAAA